jgi:hypothetical protein
MPSETATLPEIPSVASKQGVPDETMKKNDGNSNFPQEETCTDTRAVEEFKDQEILARDSAHRLLIKAFVNDRDVFLVGPPGGVKTQILKDAIAVFKANMVRISCGNIRSARGFIIALLNSLMPILDEDDLEKKKIEREIKAIKDEDEVSDNDLFEKFKKSVDYFIWFCERSRKKRTVLVIERIREMRTWDGPDRQYEMYLREAIKDNKRISYVVLDVTPEAAEKKDGKSDEIIKLFPLNEIATKNWVTAFFREACDYNLDGFEDWFGRFYEAVGGHTGSTLELMQRLRLKCQKSGIITAADVEEAIREYKQAISPIAEMYMHALSPNQIQLVEALAKEKTVSPHSEEYRLKHNLPKGGSLQSALRALTDKGCIQNVDGIFQLSIPIFAEWIRKRVDAMEPGHYQQFEL